MATAVELEFPFAIRELKKPHGAAADLFQRSFNRAPPDSPRHFVALLHRPGRESVAGYVHLRPFESDVYLCGGLCVNSRMYRELTVEERTLVTAYGSLSRWLILAATDALGYKRAVFAYTADPQNRRDALALGYVSAAPALLPFSSARKHLLVQWHNEPEVERTKLVRRVAASGPF